MIASQAAAPVTNGPGGGWRAALLQAVTTAKQGDSVAMKIEGESAEEKQRLYGRHFDHNHQLVSRISRESIDALKTFFADEMTKDDWRTIIKLKKSFQVT